MGSHKLSSTSSVQRFTPLHHEARERKQLMNVAIRDMNLAEQESEEENKQTKE
jgi:hypothetical protein